VVRRCAALAQAAGAVSAAGGSADRRPLRIGGALARRLVRSAGQLQHGFRFLKLHPKT